MVLHVPFCILLMLLLITPSAYLWFVGRRFSRLVPPLTSCFNLLYYLEHLLLVFRYSLVVVFPLLSLSWVGNITCLAFQFCYEQSCSTIENNSERIAPGSELLEELNVWSLACPITSLSRYHPSGNFPSLYMLYCFFVNPNWHSLLSIIHTEF